MSMFKPLILWFSYYVCLVNTYKKGQHGLLSNAATSVFFHFIEVQHGDEVKLALQLLPKYFRYRSLYQPSTSACLQA